MLSSEAYIQRVWKKRYMVIQY